MASPAAPQLTRTDYELILETLSANPTAANRAVREEIAAYLSAQDAWRADAERRRIDNPW